MKRLLIAIQIVLLAGMSATTALASDKTVRLNKLIELSGIRAQYAEIPKVIKSAAANPAEGGQQLPATIRAGIIDTVDGTIKPDRLIAAVIAELDAKLSDQDVDTILAWYETDRAQQITALENAASTPEAFQDVQSQMESLMSNTERVTAARKVDKLTGSSEFAVEIQMFTQLAMVSAIANALGPESGVDLDALKAQMESSRGMVIEQMQQVSTATYVYTYRNLPDSDVNEYIRFLELPASQRFISHVLSATKTTMQSMITDFTQQLVEVFQSEQLLQQ